MEENVKLGKIKKSCEAGEKVTKVFFVIAIILCVLCLVIITMIASKTDAFESWIQKGIDSGHVTFESGIGNVSAFNITIINPNNIHSDVQAIRDALQAHPYSVIFICYSIAGFFILLVFAIMMKLVGGVFRIIREEENPFTEKAIRRIITVMIVASIIMFFTPGTVYGILGLIITWVVYTILDYGKTLQIQADETL